MSAAPPHLIGHLSLQDSNEFIRDNLAAPKGYKLSYGWKLSIELLHHTETVDLDAVFVYLSQDGTWWVQFLVDDDTGYDYLPVEEWFRRNLW